MSEDEDEVEIIDPGTAARINLIDSKSSDGNSSSSPLGRECPICMDPVTTGGMHRIVATKCGHTFGKSCISRALEVKSECPSCRKRVRKRDLVDLYDVEVVAVDSSNIEKLLQQLQQEKAERGKVSEGDPRGHRLVSHPLLLLLFVPLPRQIEREKAQLACNLSQTSYELAFMKAQEALLHEEIAHLKGVSSALTRQIQSFTVSHLTLLCPQLI
jgi:endogenous inhibitor of DNA gyrase (YacG/DUF329 family)